MLYGPSGGGKSFLCWTWRFTWRLGWTGKGIPSAKHRSSTLPPREVGGGYRKRLEAWLKHHQISPRRCVQHEHAVRDSEENLADPQEAKEFIQAFEAMDTPPGLLLLDTLSWLMMGETRIPRATQGVSSRRCA